MPLAKRLLRPPGSLGAAMTEEEAYLRRAKPEKRTMSDADALDHIQGTLTWKAKKTMAENLIADRVRQTGRVVVDGGRFE